MVYCADNAVQDIESDTDGSPRVYAAEALSNVLAEFGDSRQQARDIKIDLKIFTDNDGQAFPGYMVRLFGRNMLRLFGRKMVRL
jgi:hypothetical protein